MEVLFGLIFIACGFGFIPVAIWAFVLRTRWQKTQRSLSDVEQELTNVRASSLAERERLGREVSQRLDDVDAELSRERENAQAEAERVRAHFEEEFRKAMATFEPLLRFQGLANAEQETKRALDESIKLASALKQQARPDS